MTENMDLTSMFKKKNVFLGLLIIIISVVAIFGFSFFKKKLKQIDQESLARYFSFIQNETTRFPADFKRDETLVAHIKLPYDDVPFGTLVPTYGLLCHIGKLDLPQNEMIRFEIVNQLNSQLFYWTDINLINGEDIKLIIPIYFLKDNYTATLRDNNRCQSIEFVNLMNWKNPLWEGSFDVSQKNIK